MKKHILAIIAPLAIVGCNVGNAPAGGSEAETKAVFDSMSVEEQAKFYMNSPMPLEAKKKKVEEAYQKAGKQVPADLAAQLSGGPASPTPSAPAGGPPAPTSPPRGG